LVFLNFSTVTFLERPCCTILPVTLTLEASDPESTFLSSVCTAKTDPKFTTSPTSPLTLSIRIVSPGATRYCLPPVLITAYISLHPLKTNHDYMIYQPIPSTN